MRINLPSKETVYSLQYDDFSGADFTSSPSNIQKNRSGECLNVYKDYSFSSDSIVTRKGLQKVFYNACTMFDVGEIHGMMPFNEKMYIHFGSYLMKYTAFPKKAVFIEPTVSGMSGCHIVGSAMNTKKSDSFIFRDRLYMLDGRKYMYVDEDEYLGFVSDDAAYIPTTRINSDPSGNGGVVYQEENVLTPYRKNSFLSDGMSTAYYLDGTDIQEDSVSVEIDGEEYLDFTVDAGYGIVNFSTAPPLPKTSGADNVLITFSSGIDRSSRIDKCTVCKVFDNRVFLTGNEDYPGILFHSEFEDATYFALSSYYDDGEDGVAIKSLITAGGSLIAVKEDTGNGGKVFIHTPSVDYELGKVYPVINTPIYLGSAGPGINFNDDMLYLSRRGLEAIDISDGRMHLTHRSTLIDGKLGKYSKEEMSEAKMFAWKNYLLMIISSDVYLADANKITKIGGDYVYEWYFWQFNLSDGEKINGGCSVEDRLYFTTNKGNIFSYEGELDDGHYFKSFWKTPKDYLQSASYLKSFTRKGNFITSKVMEGGKISICMDTDRNEPVHIGTFSLDGFSFDSVDFGSFSFISDGDIMIDIFPLRERFKSVSFKIFSDKEPFNISGIHSQFTIKQYD